MWTFIYIHMLSSISVQTLLVLEPSSSTRNTFNHCSSLEIFTVSCFKMTQTGSGLLTIPPSPVASELPQVPTFVYYTLDVSTSPIDETVHCCMLLASFLFTIYASDRWILTTCPLSLNKQSPLPRILRTWCRTGSPILLSPPSHLAGYPITSRQAGRNGFRVRANRAVHDLNRDHRVSQLW